MAAGRGAVLVAILLLAAALRLAWLDAGWFGVDQARDLTWAHAIASGAGLPLAGPLMRGRVRLSAIYYLFWTPPALLGEDPRLAYGYAALLGVAAVAATYALARSLAGRRAGLLGALLLATWPVAVLDSRIAWAPAALPPATAAVLLAVHGLLRRPTPGRAATTGLLAGLATQLHLAAAPVAAVAAASVLARARRLGARGVAAAGLAAAAPLATMAIAWLAGDAPSRHAAAASADAAGALGTFRSARWSAILALGSRVWAGYSPPPAERPWILSLGVRLETLAVPLLAAGAALALLALLRPRRRSPAGASPLPELATLVACFGAVALLPAEAWYYYLDTALVPGCVLLGAAAVRYAPALRSSAPLAALALARALALLVWIHVAHASGVVRANLDLLRLGGGEAADQSAPRARLPTLAVKEEAARSLAEAIGGMDDDAIRRHAHGAGFTDLDTDNGFFFRRATRAPRRSEPRPAREALVIYAGELPAAWLTAFAPPRRVGPLAIYAYHPLLRSAEARIESCGDAPLPTAPARDPRAYGSGEPLLPAWPCAPGRASVVAPVGPAPPGVEVRVLARTLGAARLAGLASDPAGEPLATRAPGAGKGLRLARTPAEVRVRLDVAGPALLDLYELHGRASG